MLPRYLVYGMFAQSDSIRSIMHNLRIELWCTKGEIKLMYRSNQVGSTVLTISLR